MQRFERFRQPLVHLWPSHRKVILDKDSDHKCELLIAALRENDVLRVVDHLQELGFDLLAQLLGKGPSLLIDSACSEGHRLLLPAYA